MGLRGQAHGIEEPEAFLPNVAVGTGDHDVLQGGEITDQVGVLKDEAELLHAECGALLFGHFGEGPALVLDPTVGRRLETTHQIEQRRLARPARSENPEELAVPDFKIDLAASKDFSPVVFINERGPANLDQTSLLSTTPTGSHRRNRAITVNAAARQMEIGTGTL